MRHDHTQGGRPRHHHPEHHRGPFQGGHRPDHPSGHRRRRPFDYGDLRLLVLGMIAERPQHGYELMKGIEERMGGGYSPSPGVIYPTLAWLEDMGYATAEAEGSRKRYRVTAEGQSFLAANEAALAELLARMAAPGPGGRSPGGRPAAALGVREAMHRLKQALRARFGQPLPPDEVARITGIIVEAAKAVEEGMSMTTADGPLTQSVAEVRTEKAAGYLAQLCKHFAHKIPASFEGNEGRIEFSRGTCLLKADGDLLTLTVETPEPDALEQLEDVVARHLLRFAFREELAIAWKRA